MNCLLLDQTSYKRSKLFLKAVRYLKKKMSTNVVLGIKVYVVLDTESNKKHYVCMTNSS